MIRDQSNMEAITCCIRYEIGPGKEGEFEHYARTWRAIIERLGGTYYWCFLPGKEPPDASHFSFPDIGRRGPDNMATVLFSFPDIASYERYRRDARLDPDFEAITNFYNTTKCFVRYERTFVRMMGS